MEKSKNIDPQMERIMFGRSSGDGIYGSEGIDRSQYIDSVSVSEEDDESIHAQSFNNSREKSIHIEGRRELMSTGDEDEVDVMSYREHNGSGLVNTRIADRESKVGSHCHHM